MTAKRSEIDGGAFRITPDPRFFYPEPSQQAAFAAVLDGLRADAGLIVIQGETGIGKTMLLRRLESTLRKTGAHAAYIPYPNFGLDTLLACFGPELGLQSGPAASVAPSGRRVVLIDDAENCPDELLAELGQRDAGSGVQIVLAGGSLLESRLDSAQAGIKERIVARARLVPLASGTVADYIRHRLRLAGGGQSEMFSSEAIEAIARYSRGIPRLINQVCARALVLADVAADRAISLMTVAEAIRDCPAFALSGEGGSGSAPARIVDVLRAEPTERAAPLPPSPAPEPSVAPTEPAAPDRPPDIPPAAVVAPVAVPAADPQRQPERPQRTGARRPKPPTTLPPKAAGAARISGQDLALPTGKPPRYAGFVPLRRRAAPPPRATEEPAVLQGPRRPTGLIAALVITALAGAGLAYGYRTTLAIQLAPALAQAWSAIDRSIAEARAGYAELERALEAWSGRDSASSRDDSAS